MASYQTQGIVLYRVSSGETDRILTLFTREYGKLSAIAKSARKSSSRSSGATEMFTESRFLLGVGKSLDVISQVEIKQAFPSLRDDLERLTRATYYCELLDRFTVERDASDSIRLFDLIIAALSLLTENAANMDMLVHAFEMRLLEILGYAPKLNACVMCGEDPSDGPLGFSPTLGGVLCRSHRFQTEDSFSILTETLEHLLTLQTARKSVLLSLSPSDKSCAEVAKALRRYVRERTDRELKSGIFLDMLRASQQTA